MSTVKHKTGPIRILVVSIALSIAFGSLSTSLKRLSAREQKAPSRRMADGKQWTTHNLNVKTAPSYCYQDAEINCLQYGRLCTWECARLERALLTELGLRGLRATAEASFTVTYKSHSAGEYLADLLVEDVLAVELKCVERLSSEHTAQCIDYLRASGRTVCLLVNFQKPKVEWKRIVHRFPDSQAD